MLGANRTKRVRQSPLETHDRSGSFRSGNPIPLGKAHPQTSSQHILHPQLVALAAKTPSRCGHGPLQKAHQYTTVVLEHVSGSLDAYQMVKGFPAYVHLKGLAIVLLKKSMKALILALRSAWLSRGAQGAFLPPGPPRPAALRLHAATHPKLAPGRHPDRIRLAVLPETDTTKVHHYDVR